MQNRYRVRGCVSTFVKETKTTVLLKCLFQASRQVVTFELSFTTYSCFKMLNGQFSLQEISETQNVNHQEVQELIEYLLGEKIIEPAGQEAIHGRYQRQENFFSSFERNHENVHLFQSRLASASVAIVGLGGIGSWVVEGLARVGVGSLFLIDGDVVDLHNLPRQALYREQDVGKKKTVAAKENLHAINGKIVIHSKDTFVESKVDIEDIVRQVDVVINCADSPDVEVTNAIVSEASFQYLKPHILCGGYDGHLSFVGPTVIPHKTACWGCYQVSDIYERGLDGFHHLAITESVIQGGTIAPIASITANIHVLEAVKLVSGYDKPRMTNCKGELRFDTYQLTLTKFTKQKDCRFCNQKPKKGKR